MPSLKIRDDLTIDCPLCDKPAKVFELWNTGAFTGYALRCDCGNFYEIPSKYSGQIESKQNETR